MNVAVIDLVAIMLILLMGVRGMMRGFTREIFSLLSFVVGMMGAWLYRDRAAEFLSQYLDNQPWLPVVGFILSFLSIIIVLTIIENIVTKMAASTPQGREANGFLGFLAGMAEGFIIAAVIIWVSQSNSFFNAEQFLGDSIIAPYFEKANPFFDQVKARLL